MCFGVFFLFLSLAHAHREAAQNKETHDIYVPREKKRKNPEKEEGEGGKNLLLNPDDHPPSHRAHAKVFYQHRWSIMTPVF